MVVSIFSWNRILFPHIIFLADTYYSSSFSIYWYSCWTFIAGYAGSCVGRVLPSLFPKISVNNTVQEFVVAQPGHSFDAGGIFASPEQEIHLCFWVISCFSQNIGDKLFSPKQILVKWWASRLEVAMSRLYPNSRPSLCAERRAQREACSRQPKRLKNLVGPKIQRISAGQLTPYTLWYFFIIFREEAMKSGWIRRRSPEIADLENDDDLWNVDIDTDDEKMKTSLFRRRRKMGSI